MSLKDLMARMGHDSERAAVIYQHEARGADLAITSDGQPDPLTCGETESE